MACPNFVTDLKQYVDAHSQKSLEKLTGVSQATISKILKKPKRDIKISTLKKLWPCIYGKPFPLV